MKKLLALLIFIAAACLHAQAPNYPYTTLIVPQVQIPGATSGQCVKADGTGAGSCGGVSPALTLNLANYGAVADDSTDNCVGGSGANNPVHNFLAAVNAYGGVGVVEAQITMPPGGKAYKTSCGFAFTTAQTVLDGGGTIDYTGSGVVVTLGRPGQTANVGNFYWGVNNIHFRGGALMSAGILLEGGNEVYHIYDNDFYDFGNSSAWAIDGSAAAYNEALVYDNVSWNDDSTAGRNFARFVDTTQTGNSSVYFHGNTINGGPANSYPLYLTAPCAGIALYLDSSHDKVLMNSFFGNNASIVLGSSGQVQGTTISNNSFDSDACTYNGVNSAIHLGSVATSGTIDTEYITGNDVCRGSLFDKAGSTGTVSFTNSVIAGNTGFTSCSTPAITAFSGVHTGSMIYANTEFASVPYWPEPDFATSLVYQIVPATGSIILASDTFTRANSANLGANWTAMSGALDTTTLGISSNAAVPITTGAHASSYYNAISFTPNQCSYVTETEGGNSDFAGPTVRNSGSADTYYLFFVKLLANSVLYKVLAGTPTAIATLAPYASGSIAGLCVNGTTLTTYINGAQVGSPVTDVSISTGQPGVHGYLGVGASVGMTNWQGTEPAITITDSFGTGAPSNCGTSYGIGSTYHRTDGSTGSTFYVCENAASPAWVAY